MSSAYDIGLKEGAMEVLSTIFPRENLEDYFGVKMNEDVWFEVASSLAANLDIALSERSGFNDSYEDMMADLHEMLGVPYEDSDD